MPPQPLHPTPPAESHPTPPKPDEPKKDEPKQPPAPPKPDKPKPAEKHRGARTCYLLTMPDTPGTDSAKLEALVTKLADRLGCEVEDVFVLPAGFSLATIENVTPKPTDKTT